MTDLVEGYISYSDKEQTYEKPDQNQKQALICCCVISIVVLFIGSGLFLGVNKNGSALLELENLNEKSKETKQNQEVKEFIAGKMRKKGEGILTTIYNKCRCIVNVHDKRSRKFYYFVFFSLATLLARAFLVKRSKI